MIIASAKLPVLMTSGAATLAGKSSWRQAELLTARDYNAISMMYGFAVLFRMAGHHR
jgi:hypothetical protein